MMLSQTPKRSEQLTCFLVPLRSESQHLRKDAFVQALQTAIGKNIDRIEALYRLYGRYDYALVVRDGPGFDIKGSLRNALNDMCDKPALMFTGSAEETFVQDGAFRIFCHWNSFTDKAFKEIENFCDALSSRPEYASILFDFIAYDGANIVLSVASRAFDRLDAFTDALDALTHFGRKETFVVSSSSFRCTLWYRICPMRRGIGKAMDVDQNIQSLAESITRGATEGLIRGASGT